MSNKLEEARKIINQVDAQMAQLFIKRMEAAEMVYEYKKEYGLPILDKEREDMVIKNNSAMVWHTSSSKRRMVSIERCLALLTLHW